MLDRAKGKEVPIQTPWPSLDQAIGGGFWPGLHILVGTTASGKTQWALQTALQAAKDNVPVLYVGLELGKLDLIARLAGLLTGRKWSTLFLGQDRLHVEEAIDTVAHELTRLPIHLEEAPPYAGWTGADLYARTEALKLRYEQPFG